MSTSVYRPLTAAFPSRSVPRNIAERSSIAFAPGHIAYALNEFAKANWWDLKDLYPSAASFPQHEWLNWRLCYSSAVEDLHKLPARMSSAHTELNDLLAKHHYPPCFSKFEEQTVGVASIFGFDARWTTPGKRDFIYRETENGTVRHPAFRLSASTARLEPLSGSSVFTDRTVIETDSGYRVYLAMLPSDKAPRTEIELLGLCRSMLTARRKFAPFSVEVVIPAVTLAVSSELRWLEGLLIKVPGDYSYTVASCRQEVAFNMSATGLCGYRGLVDDFAPSDTTHGCQVIKRHFVLAIVHNGAPLFAAYLSPLDSWQTVLM